MADQTPEKPTGDPRWDAVLARLEAKAAEEEARKAAEVENASLRAARRAREATPRGVRAGWKRRTRPRTRRDRLRSAATR